MSNEKSSFECLRRGSEILLSLHIVPRARRNAVLGLHGARLKVSIAAAPADNAANEALVDFLAKETAIPKRAIRLVHGQTSRQKTVAFSNEYEERLSAWLKVVLENAD